MAAKQVLSLFAQWLLGAIKKDAKGDLYLPDGFATKIERNLLNSLLTKKTDFQSGFDDLIQLAHVFSEQEGASRVAQALLDAIAKLSRRSTKRVGSTGGRLSSAAGRKAMRHLLGNTSGFLAPNAPRIADESVSPKSIHPWQRHKIKACAVKKEDRPKKG